MAKRRARSPETAPSSKSEPVTDPAEVERLLRIFAFGELALKAFGSSASTSKLRTIVARPQGAALTWAPAQILKLKDLAARGRPIPWEVTDLDTQEVALMWSPLLDSPPGRKSGRRPGWRKLPLHRIEDDLAQHPGSSQEARAKRLGIHVKTLRGYLKQRERPPDGNLTGK